MFIDESQGVQDLLSDNPPPPAILPQVQSAVFSEAISKLRDGKSGIVLVHERSQDGSVNQTNAAYVHRVGDNVSVSLWLGRDWGKPGTVSFGGSLIVEFD